MGAPAGRLLIVRQIVQQVRQRLGVHQPMFQRDLNDLFGRLIQ